MKKIFLLLFLNSIVFNAQEKSSDEVFEIPPYFRECKKIKKRTVSCFEKQFLKHFKRRFNSELPYKLDIKSGKKTINISFIVNTLGEIDSINVNAPHEKIELEVLRVLKKFPKLKPATQNGIVVPVKYSIPIFLFVGESKSERKERKQKEKLEREARRNKN